MARNILLRCGILSSLLYVAMNIFIPMGFAGYSSVSQTVSELSAVDAPTRPVWVGWAMLYTLLVLAFGWGVLQSAGQNRRLWIVGMAMLGTGVLDMLWPFAPMHRREVLAAGGETLSDTMHIAIAVATVVLMMLMVGFGAAALGKRFRIFSIVSMAFIIVFGALIGMDGPRVSKNLPTPFAGVWERINIGVFLLWVVVLGVALLQANKKPESQQAT